MRSFPLSALILVVAAGCAREPLDALRQDSAELARRAEDGTDRVQVQHCLIAFDAAMPNKATRSRDEAEALAADVYARARAGEDFAALVAQYSDDASSDGIYDLVKDEKKQSRDQGVIFRGNMVPAFGDAAWRLDVGEIGVAAWSPVRCQFGWHVIKRLR